MERVQSQDLSWPTVPSVNKCQDNFAEWITNEIKDEILGKVRILKCNKVECDISAHPYIYNCIFFERRQLEWKA